jgi:hypothetical protein
MKTTYRKLSGAKFKGSIEEIPTNRSDNTFVTPRRMLRTAPSTIIDVRETFRTLTGRKYLCASNGEAENGIVIYKTFRLFELDKSFSWTRRVTSKNMATGLMSQSDTPDDFGTIYGALEPIGKLEDQLRIPEKKYRLITGARLEIDDRIDDYIVTRVDEIIGITFAELKG